MGDDSARAPPHVYNLHAVIFSELPSKLQYIALRDKCPIRSVQFFRQRDPM